MTLLILFLIKSKKIVKRATDQNVYYSKKGFRFRIEQFILKLIFFKQLYKKFSIKNYFEKIFTIKKI